MRVSLCYFFCKKMEFEFEASISFALRQESSRAYPLRATRSRGRGGPPRPTARAFAGSRKAVISVLHGINLTFTVYNLYTTVLLVILHHMDTSTSSKDEGEPVFHSSKVV